MYPRIGLAALVRQRTSFNTLLHILGFHIAVLAPMAKHCSASVTRINGLFVQLVTCMYTSVQIIQESCHADSSVSVIDAAASC